MNRGIVSATCIAYYAVRDCLTKKNTLHIYDAYDCVAVLIVLSLSA